jgi:hypothetical protein
MCGWRLSGLMLFTYAAPTLSFRFAHLYLTSYGVLDVQLILVLFLGLV